MLYDEFVKYYCEHTKHWLKWIIGWWCCCSGVGVGNVWSLVRKDLHLLMAAGQNGLTGLTAVEHVGEGLPWERGSAINHCKWNLVCFKYYSTFFVILLFEVFFSSHEYMYDEKAKQNDFQHNFFRPQYGGKNCEGDAKVQKMCNSEVWFKLYVSISKM